MSKTNKPLIAVITRTKDRPVFLRRAILSVSSQTSKDFVHVIYNDAGNEQEVDEIVSQSAGKDYETIVVHNKDPKGLEAASNNAITASKSEFIVIHDDDDTWNPRFAEEVLAHIEANPDTNGIVVRTDKVVEKLRKNGSIKVVKKTRWMPEVQAINLYRQFIENQMTPITFVYKRSVYNEIGGYDESLKVMGDWDFGIKYIKKYDIDYLDPGYALANYHFRKFKAGAQGNTSYGGNNLRATVGNHLMNKYLREELIQGKIGPGFIMSQARFEHNFKVRQMAKFMPKFIARKFLNRYTK